MAGIASCVPAQVVSSAETAAAAGASLKEAAKIVKMTGVQQRRVAPPGLCTSDMACLAAERLLADLEWDRDSVEAVVLVTQTADYSLPASACILQHRLGLSSGCAAFDVALGCSGYIYGLWLCASLIASGSIRRALLLAGDTSTWACSPQDRSTAFLFGDAATATALEACPDAPPMDFVLGTDGSGHNFLVVPGGYRNRVTAETIERKPDESGRLRGALDLHMEGAEVFQFTMEQVPPMIEKLLSSSGRKLEEMDAFVPHQANQYMLQVLSEALNIPAGKLVLSLGEFGNTSSASIPLTCSYKLADRMRRERVNLILAGFGVGWSWGAAAVTCGPMVISDIVCAGDEQPVALV
jgi:3-oxoacyl-[acyl-carrier-protein] synthase-3